MHIVEIEIRGFQSHADTKLRLHNGINVFVGTSDSGKSAILRAIRWCLDNTPSGNEFIRKGEKEAFVAVTLSNGFRIERLRNQTGTTNQYDLYKDGTHVNTFTGFGKNVPPEVLEAHGIQPIANGVYFNFANQLEAPFLLADTPKVRAETIGNLEELGKIDHALNGTNDDIRLYKKQVKSLDDEIKALEKEYLALRHEIEQSEPRVQTLETLKQAITQKLITRTNLENRSDRLSSIQTEIEALGNIVMSASRVVQAWDENLPEQIEQAKKLDTAFERLTVIDTELSRISFVNANSLHTLSTLIESVDRQIDTFHKLNRSGVRLEEIQRMTSDIRFGISERVSNLEFGLLDKEVETYKFIFKYLNRLDDIQKEMIQVNEGVEGSRRKIEELLDQFVQALQNEEVCPTCAQTTNQVCAHDINKII